MNIVFLNPSGTLGGAETALLQMVAALRDARPNWKMSLVVSEEGPLELKARAMSLPTAALAFPASLQRLGEWGSRGSLGARLSLGASVGAAAYPALKYTSRLRRQLAELAPDIIHTNGLKMHVLGARARERRAKLVWHLHDYPDTRPMSAALLTHHAAHCDAVVANSESVAGRARQMLGTNVPVHALLNTIDLDRFHPEGPRADLDALANLPPLEPGHLRVGLVATFAKWKGHEVFFDALARIGVHERLRGYVIGGPIYRTSGSQFTMPQLRELALTRGLGSNVGFTGHIEDVPSALRALDVVVHASVEPEPFGLVIAEGMACGRPLVVSRGGGAAEIAQAGALFHSPGNAIELAECITQLARSAEMRASLGRAGRCAAMKLFSHRRFADTLVPIYESLAAR